MKLDEEKMKEMKDKFGKEEINNFANILLDLMVTSGDENAMTMKLRYEVVDLINEKVMDNIFINNLQNKEITEKVNDFLMQIKLETENFIKEMEEK